MVKSDKRACSGCGLCAECCPVNAIKMLPDDDGFLYPQINKELCTGCGLCEKICPFYPEFTINGKSEPDETYIARSKSGAVLKKSASGGLFTFPSFYTFSGTNLSVSQIFSGPTGLTNINNSLYNI